MNLATRLLLLTAACATLTTIGCGRHDAGANVQITDRPEWVRNLYGTSPDITMRAELRFAWIDAFSADELERAIAPFATRHPTDGVFVVSRSRLPEVLQSLPTSADFESVANPGERDPYGKDRPEAVGVFYHDADRDAAGMLVYRGMRGNHVALDYAFGRSTTQPLRRSPLLAPGEAEIALIPAKSGEPCVGITIVSLWEQDWDAYVVEAREQYAIGSP